MSAENHVKEIDVEIHDYINSYPLGQTREKIHKKFGIDYMKEHENKEDKYSQIEIDNALARLETNDWVLVQGRTIRSIKVQ